MSPKDRKGDRSDTDFAEEPADSEPDDEDVEEVEGHVDPRELEVHENSARGGIANHAQTNVKTQGKATKKLISPSQVRNSQKATSKINASTVQSANSDESRSHPHYQVYQAPATLRPFLSRKLRQATRQTIQRTHKDMETEALDPSSLDTSAMNHPSQGQQVMESPANNKSMSKSVQPVAKFTL